MPAKPLSATSRLQLVVRPEPAAVAYLTQVEDILRPAVWEVEAVSKLEQVLDARRMMSSQ